MILAELLFSALLVMGGVRGFKSGGVQGLADVVASIVAFLVARWGYTWVAKLMAVFVPGGNQSLALFLGFLVLFVIIWKLVGMLLGLIVFALKIVTSLPGISLINKIAGAVLGVITMVIVIGATSYMVMKFQLDPTVMKWFGSSTVALYCQQMFMKALFFLV